MESSLFSDNDEVECIRSQEDGGGGGGDGTPTGGGEPGAGGGKSGLYPILPEPEKKDWNCKK